MACGILPGHGDLLVRDSTKPVAAQLSQAFTGLHLDDSAIESLNSSLTTQTTSAHALPGFVDLLVIWSAWLPIPNHGVDIVESPFPVHVTPMGRRPEARVVWRFLLQQMPHPSNAMKQVLDVYNEWEMIEPARFYSFYEVKGNDPGEERMRSFFKTIFDKAEPYWYQVLIDAHVAVNAHSLKQAEDNISTERTSLRPEIPLRDNSEFDHGDPIFTERAFAYAENITTGGSYIRPEIPLQNSLESYHGDPIFTERAFVHVENIAKLSSMIGRYQWNPSPSITIEDAWWMMMLRMQAWNMGIKLITREGVTVSHQYYNDQSRVYIL
jgi:hypothetical protein